MNIRPAGSGDVNAVAQLLFELFEELASPAASSYELTALVRTTRALFAGRIWAFLAETDGQPVGALTLNESAAIYAGGIFGEICEMYVRPRLRNRGVGKRLLESAVEFARERGWSRLEVGAPELPRWKRSVDFYRQAGFAEVGPRLKLALDVPPA